MTRDGFCVVVQRVMPGEPKILRTVIFNDDVWRNKDAFACAQIGVTSGIEGPRISQPLEPSSAVPWRFMDMPRMQKQWLMFFSQEIDTGLASTVKT